MYTFQFSTRFKIKFLMTAITFEISVLYPAFSLAQSPKDITRVALYCASVETINNGGVFPKTTLLVLTDLKGAIKSAQIATPHTGYTVELHEYIFTEMSKSTIGPLNARIFGTNKDASFEFNLPEPNGLLIPQGVLRLSQYDVGRTLEEINVSLNCFRFSWLDT